MVRPANDRFSGGYCPVLRLLFCGCIYGAGRAHHSGVGGGFDITASFGGGEFAPLYSVLCWIWLTVFCLLGVVNWFAPAPDNPRLLRRG